MNSLGPDHSRWIGGVALSTAVLAVLAAITTLYLGKYSSRAIMLQGQETNQWAYYQAKSIKSHAYELGRERLQLELIASGGKMPRAVAEKYDNTCAGYADTIRRYDREKEEIKTKAESMSKEKELAQHRGGNFGYGLIFIQIAIMLSSVAALTKRKSLWYLGLLCSVGWLFFFLDAFYLFF